MSDIFFAIHDGLPREAPGSSACTRRALASVSGLSAGSRVLDVGCGPGAQTIELARAFGGRIVAVDLHAPYLAELRRRAIAANAASRVQPLRATMGGLPFAEASFDVIWSEGAIYIIGVERALADWRPLLRARGHLVFSHLCWLADDPPPAPAAFWATHYPAMRSVRHHLDAAAECGYDAIDTFVLPDRAWWDEYYGPLERRLSSVRATRTGEEDRRAIEATQEQIDLYRTYAASYGYVFFVLRRR